MPLLRRNHFIQFHCMCLRTLWILISYYNQTFQFGRSTVSKSVLKVLPVQFSAVYCITLLCCAVKTSAEDCNSFRLDSVYCTLATGGSDSSSDTESFLYLLLSNKTGSVTGPTGQVKNSIGGSKTSKSSSDQCSAVQCSAVQCSEEQYSAVKYSAVQCSLVYCISTCGCI